MQIGKLRQLFLHGDNSEVEARGHKTGVSTKWLYQIEIEMPDQLM